MANDPRTSDLEKAAAARASLGFVHDGNIVGLGTGSTAAHAVRFLGERVRAGLQIRGIPTSVHTRDLATSVGIPLTTFDEIQPIGLQPMPGLTNYYHGNVKAANVRKLSRSWHFPLTSDPREDLRCSIRL